MHSIASVKKNLDRYIQFLGLRSSTEEEISMVEKKTTATEPTPESTAWNTTYAAKPHALAEKEHRLLIQAKVDLANCQKEFIDRLMSISDRIARHKMNLEWLKQNPMAEEIFTQFLDREIAAHDAGSPDLQPLAPPPPSNPKPLRTSV